MIQGLGPVVGPGLGGLLLSLGSWHWLFWINVPLCLLGLLGVQFFQPTHSQASKAAINVVSSILLGLSLLCGLLALNTPRLSGSVHVVLTALTLALGVAFAFLDKQQPAPLILPQLQSSAELRLLVGLTGVIGAVTTVVFLVPPFLWTQLAHLQAWQVGLLALAAPAAFTVTARLTPKLRGLESRSSLLLLGLLLMTLGLGIAALMLHWQSGIALCLPLLVYGCGAGILQVEAVTRMTAQVSAEIQATLGSTQRLVQNLGIALSSALVGSLLTRVSLLIGGQTAFWLAAGLTFLALLVTAKQNRRMPVPVEFLSDEQAARYGRLAVDPTPEQLTRYFFLNEADLALIAERRRDHNKLGFAIQLCTLRYLGTFLPNPIQVPKVVVQHVAQQLEVSPEVFSTRWARKPAIPIAATSWLTWATKSLMIFRCSSSFAGFTPTSPSVPRAPVCCLTSPLLI
ncbi:putative multidrug resistance protein MdtD [Deinococcus carri]|uniref:Multidrug resistance protein MdtD n=1 Tax=Deinococcus carri TaxID=1211323 RepID=A0ABP9WFL3_9DEIO